jgi:hypothetical protein
MGLNMTLKHVLSVGLATAAIALASQANAAANLISDGDFSSPALSGSWTIGSPSLDGWTSLVGDGIEIGGSSNYGLSCVSNGCQNLELNANVFGEDSYIVSGLTVGKTYTLSYDYGVRNSGGPSSATTTFGGQLVTTDGVTNGNYWANGWSFESFTVVANATSEALVLTAADTGTPSYGNEYTNFSLTATPEISTWAMMGLGFAGLAFAGFHSRRKAFSVV